MCALRRLVFLACIVLVPAAFANQGHTKFTILAAPEPTQFRVDNSQFGLGLVIHKIRNAALSSNFSEDMVKLEPKLNEYLRREISGALLANGWEELNPPAYGFNSRNLWKVDYQSLQTQSDVIIHAYVDYIGVASSSYSLQYQPVLYVNYCLVYLPNARNCKIENTIIFGDGTKKDGELTYFAPDVYRWDSADQVFASQREIIDSYKYGLKRIANDIANQVWYNYPARVASDKFIPWQNPKDESKANPAVEAKLPVKTEPAESGRKDSTSPETKPLATVPKRESPASDIPERLRVLDQIFKDGLIKKDEYEMKKRELLDRI
ncbi:SHOCT domain-containing protein [Dechloromonas sp.]|uniref:SHOCT domain-containing protein n=1 Tax=Dechloromonas sp. TaxID=1917218 RepID=UPI00216BD84A|nr:SHOCT domain-containing protein [Dechloromonas sp.]MBU3697779.1 SHOCT domain-containing protein [Dechloromonas sp.]